MLEGKNISYQIGQKKLLNRVSVLFKAGIINLVIGPNGAGKSTLMKVLCHQIHANHGEVLYGERNIKSFSTSGLARIRAVLSQHYELAFPMTVSEVVMMGRYPHFREKPGELDKEACMEAMRYFDVEELSERNFMSLSGGEKQRVHFARVAAQVWWPEKGSTRYLILDEPLAFLDIYYQYEFMYKLQELLKQNDLIVAGVIHDLNLAARFAGELVLLHQGTILASGTTERVLTPENILKAYQMKAVIQRMGDTFSVLFQ